MAVRMPFPGAYQEHLKALIGRLPTEHLSDKRVAFRRIGRPKSTVPQPDTELVVSSKLEPDLNTAGNSVVHIPGALVVVSKPELDMNITGHPVVHIPGFRARKIFRHAAGRKHKRSCDDETLCEEEELVRLQLAKRRHGNRRESEQFDWESREIWQQRWGREEAAFLSSL